MDKRSKEYRDIEKNKMITSDKVVFHCVCCNRDFIGEKDKMPNTCPACRNPKCIVINNTLVINK